jgi:hypothetical protein
MIIICVKIMRKAMWFDLHGSEIRNINRTEGAPLRGALDRGGTSPRCGKEARLLKVVRKEVRKEVL